MYTLLVLLSALTVLFRALIRLGLLRSTLGFTLSLSFGSLLTGLLLLTLASILTRLSSLLLLLLLLSPLRSATTVLFRPTLRSLGLLSLIFFLGLPGRRSSPRPRRPCATRDVGGADKHRQRDHS